MKKEAKEEFLAVARMAGIDVPDPKETLNKFDDEDMLEDDVDVSVQWDVEVHDCQQLHVDFSPC